MNRQDAFLGYSPQVNFIFYIGTVFFTVLIVHPAFLICSLVLSAVYYLQVRGRQGLRMIGGMIPVFVVVSAVNPLLNTGGDRILFHLGQRPYTLEALYYVMALGCMFTAVILWFASYNRTMTSDKFMFVFGRKSPVISMILTMVFRMVPGFQRKAHQITTARRCIGRMETGSSLQSKLLPSFAVVSSLTSWALEGGVVTADSMQSRGYGSGKRSAFSIYSFVKRDRLTVCLMVLLMAGILAAVLRGGTRASYTPELMVTGYNDPWLWVGSICWFVFLSIPVAVDVVEEMRWHVLRSKI